MSFLELSKHFVFAGLLGRQVEAKQFDDIMRAQQWSSGAMSKLEGCRKAFWIHLLSWSDDKTIQ